MNFFEKIVRYITSINKWVAYFTLVLMMPLVTFFAVTRSLGSPVIGDVELVQFFMVVLIVGSLAFTEATDSHISIGIITEKLPARLQLILDLVAQAFTYIFGFFICWVFISNINFLQASNLLTIPFWPFKILFIFGFFGWGLEALLKFSKSIRSVI